MRDLNDPPSQPSKAYAGQSLHTGGEEGLLYGRLASSLVAGLLVVAGVTGCGAGNDSEAAISDAVARASEMAAEQKDRSSPPAQTTQGSGQSAGSSSLPAPTESTVSTPVDAKPAPTAPDSGAPKGPDQSGSSATGSPSTDAAVAAWVAYPWGSDGLECPHPSRMLTGEPTVAVIGDSNIRDGMPALSKALAEVGSVPVFVCWGGKQLPWGTAQVETMEASGLLPSCLVVNLGTNDLKGTTARGLADAVRPGIIADRLTDLLTATSGVGHVVVVDVAADTARAPSTMQRVDELPAIYAQAVSAFGNASLVTWSSAVRDDPGLLSSDGYHDSTQGQDARAQLIASAVASACSG